MADYCVYQDRCHWEVENKMREFQLIPEARDEILIYLIQNNFLNEERFTRSFVRGKFNQKKWGKTKIQSALLARKVPINLIEKSFDEIDFQEYLSTLESLATKKWDIIQGDTIWEKRKKLQSYLIQKGYEWHLVKEILQEKTFN